MISKLLWGKNAVILIFSIVSKLYCICSFKELHDLLSACGRALRSGCRFAPGFSWTWRCSRRCTRARSYNLPSHSWRPRSHYRWTRWRPGIRSRVKSYIKSLLQTCHFFSSEDLIQIQSARSKIHGKNFFYFYIEDEAKLETEQHTCLMSQLTFHCLIVLYLHVFTTSSTFRSMRIRRLLAIPRISSLRLPLNL